MRELVRVILGVIFFFAFGTLAVAPYAEQIDDLKRKLRDSIERERLLGEELKKYTALAKEKGRPA